jgi:hypothetical protein
MPVLAAAHGPCTPVGASSLLRSARFPLRHHCLLSKPPGQKKKKKGAWFTALCQRRVILRQGHNRPPYMDKANYYYYYYLLGLFNGDDWLFKGDLSLIAVWIAVWQDISSYLYLLSSK